MLSPFDDHPIHQLVEPISQWVSGDRNVFERYRFHGGRCDGSLLFACTLGLYPNRELIDAAFTIALDGVQHSIHASARLAPGDRRTHVGPFTIEVVEPLHTFRVELAGREADELGVRAALTFRAERAPVEAPRQMVRTGARARDTIRFTQWGSWDGHLDLDGQMLPVGSGTGAAPTRATGGAATFGLRERSWGVSPVGEPVGGAPEHELPQRFAVWSSARFSDETLDVELDEDAQGRRRHTTATRDSGRGDADAGGPEPLRDAAVSISWQPGTRRPQAAVLTVTPWNAVALDVELTPRAALALRGLGFQSPDWMLGAFRGEAVVGREQWVVTDLDPSDVHNLHWHQLCHARTGEEEGIAVLEVLPVGAHAPSGLTGFVDGASEPTP